MSIFKRGLRISPDMTDTLIGEGTVFHGNLRSEGGVRIEGTVAGDIECKGDLTVGEKGVAESNISARNVSIIGTVRGSVSAGKLVLYAKGRLYGDVVCSSLVIEEGALFEGTSKMVRSSEQADQSVGNGQSGSSGAFEAAQASGAAGQSKPEDRADKTDKANKAGRTDIDKSEKAPKSNAS